MSHQPSSGGRAPSPNGPRAQQAPKKSTEDVDDLGESPFAFDLDDAPRFTGEDSPEMPPGLKAACCGGCRGGEAPAAQQQDGQPAPAGETAEGGAPPAIESDGPGRAPVLVRYGAMKQVGVFRHNLDVAPPRGAKLVIRSERGVEIGEVLFPITREKCIGCLSRRQVDEFSAANGPEYSIHQGGKVVRLANAQDMIDQRHMQTSAKEAGRCCRQIIREMSLQMKMVSVEHLLGGERIIFYFISEHRVDFRELVRRLATQYHTRIEMRQVGARDEARLVADLERCGQVVCCQQYMKDLKPVSMRMAKTQKATLDPSKISGRCGRLMCCLRYEDLTYEELKRKLPKKNIWVRTEKLLGRVVEGQIITQLVRLQLVDGTYEVVANEEILERNVEAPPPPPPRPERPERPSRSSMPRRKLFEEPQPGEAAGEPGERAAYAAGEQQPIAAAGARANGAEGEAPAAMDSEAGDGQADAAMAYAGPGDELNDAMAPAASGPAGDADAGDGGPDGEESDGVPAGPHGRPGQPMQGEPRRRRRRRRRRGGGGQGDGGQGGPARQGQLGQAQGRAFQPQGNQPGGPERHAQFGQPQGNQPGGPDQGPAGDGFGGGDQGGEDFEAGPADGEPSHGEGQGGGEQGQPGRRRRRRRRRGRGGGGGQGDFGARSQGAQGGDGGQGGQGGSQGAPPPPLPPPAP